MMLRKYWPNKEKFLQMTMAVGRVVRKDVKERVEVSVQRHRMNDYLCIYFPESNNLVASDPEDKCTIGDIVLLQKHIETFKHVETHKVQKIIHKTGNIVDPMTGLRVQGSKYLDGEPLLSEEKFKSLTEEISKRENYHQYSYEISPDTSRWESRNLQGNIKKKRR